MPGKKDGEATSGQKLLVLYSLLVFSGREFSLTELADTLHCSKQTVLRLLDQMEAGSVKGLIRESRSGRSYYRMQRPARRPMLALSPEALEQLVLCRDFVLHLLPGKMRADMEHALDRAAALLPDGVDAADLLLSRAAVLTKGSIDYTPFQTFLERIRAAMRRKTALSVSYRSVAGGESREYDFAPARLLSFREALYVQGWLVAGKGRMEIAKDAPLSLAVHRLREVTLTRRSFASLTLPALPEDGIFGFSVEEPFRVRVRFTPGAASTYVRERIWSRDQTLETDGAGGTILEFTARSLDEVISWALGFGPQAEILAPEEARTEVRRTVAALAALYPPD
ncbi:MAG: WYL domain-containing protein [Desulfovibrio sp.]|jgi:predicted DNA-binding transcriptional regulator YafY|nr:WYL domain-containing protein [Desulfovibrio sp.]